MIESSTPCGTSTHSTIIKTTLNDCIDTTKESIRAKKKRIRSGKAEKYRQNPAETTKETIITVTTRETSVTRATPVGSQATEEQRRSRKKKKKRSRKYGNKDRVVLETIQEGSVSQSIMPIVEALKSSLIEIAGNSVVKVKEGNVFSAGAEGVGKENNPSTIDSVVKPDSSHSVINTKNAKPKLQSKPEGSTNDKGTNDTSIPGGLLPRKRPISDGKCVIARKLKRYKESSYMPMSLNLLCAAIDGKKAPSQPAVQPILKEAPRKHNSRQVEHKTVSVPKPIRSIKKTIPRLQEKFDDISSVENSLDEIVIEEEDEKESKPAVVSPPQPNQHEVIASSTADESMIEEDDLLGTIASQVHVSGCNSKLLDPVTPEKISKPEPVLENQYTPSRNLRWEELTVDQRIYEITTSPHITAGTVERSIKGLTLNDSFSVLHQWLETAVWSTPEDDEKWTGVIGESWSRIAELTSDEEELDDLKARYDYQLWVEPRVTNWSKQKARKAELEREMERLWGNVWKQEFGEDGRPVASQKQALCSRELVTPSKWSAKDSDGICPERGKLCSPTLLSPPSKEEYQALGGTREQTGTCGCPKELYSILLTLPRPKSCSMVMPQDAAATLMTSIHTLLPEPKKFSSLCHSHLRRLASGAFGLLNNITDHEVLEARLTYIFNHPNADPPHTHTFPSWFRKPLRQPCTVRTDLGLYKFAVRNPTSVTKAFSTSSSGMDGLKTFTFDRETVFARMSSPGKFQEFCDYGTVRIPNLFAHLDMKIISAEFEMYKHHFYPPPGTKPMGWLRIMYHSLTQQAIRQDPALYALHAAAREDGCWRFISYPYYTKSTDPNGEKTGFKHFDINVGNYLGKEGIGNNVVQSAINVAEYDETPEGCTILVPGFHKHIKEWWKKRKADTHTGGETTNIIPGKNWTKEDEHMYGPFLPYPCKSGETRITRPDLPHGSTPVSNENRRVVFPWYIGIRDDHETLDVPTAESWSALAANHRDLTACYKSTSGRSASAYGRPGHRWAAAVRLGSTSCIGDALVGRRRWDDPEVVKERDFVLGGGPERDEEVKLWLEETRGRIKREFERCWEVVKKVEREEYGEVAFWAEGEGKRKGGLKPDGVVVDEEEAYGRLLGR